MAPKSAAVKMRDDVEDLLPVPEGEPDRGKSVTFYSWMGRDAKGRAHASCQVVHISGGTRGKTDGGMMVGIPVVEARFNNGVCTTDNPEIIKELRRLAKDGKTSITEDHELYLSKTLSAEDQMKRATVAGNVAQEQNRELVQENNRLRQLLEKQGKADPGRTGAAA